MFIDDTSAAIVKIKVCQSHVPKGKSDEGAP